MRVTLKMWRTISPSSTLTQEGFWCYLCPISHLISTASNSKLFSHSHHKGISPIGWSGEEAVLKGYWHIQLMTKVDTCLANMNKNNKNILDADERSKGKCWSLFWIFKSSVLLSSRCSSLRMHWAQVTLYPESLCGGPQGGGYQTFGGGPEWCKGGIFGIFKEAFIYHFLVRITRFWTTLQRPRMKSSWD